MSVHHVLQKYTDNNNFNKIYSKMKSTTYDKFSFFLVQLCEQNW